jgi:hypothetical protein
MSARTYSSACSKLLSRETIFHLEIEPFLFSCFITTETAAIPELPVRVWIDDDNVISVVFNRSRSDFKNSERAVL